MTEISVIIPTRNEAKGIGPTICDIRQVFSDSEILVVDSKSSDGTTEIAKAFGAKVISADLGKGRAVGKALRFIRDSTKWLIIIDGDYTYPAKYLPQMRCILERNKNVGMVLGNQVGYISNRGLTIMEGSRARILRKALRGVYMPGPDYFFRRLLTILHHLLNGVTTRSSLSGQRMIRYNCLKNFQPMARGFDIEVEINSYIVRKGYGIVEIPIVSRQRLGKSKFVRLKHALEIFRRMVLARLSASADARATENIH